ncbi:hypothetical protein PQG02_02550 [Nostoc sp. UHCC 0926]|uniref:hypothetical protein n=1 Tax=unclassified Nostoc TaxID=2593658 RepID=UPI002362705E|nr:hypothetical protein [Nostoc sp. UHCC 0926]WDD33302.1 hypothetical protein PQG02_02550 [Nostoc sp. UHCC 0926]
MKDENDPKKNLEELKRKIDYRQDEVKDSNKISNLFQTSNILFYISILLFIISGLSLIYNNENNEKYINILIVDNIGKPIENAEVVFVNESSPSIQNTNNQGFIQLKVPPQQELDVLIRKNGFTPMLARIGIKEESKINKIYQLEIEKHTP